MKLNRLLWRLLDSKWNLETVMCLGWFHWPSIYLHVFGSNVMWLHFPGRHRSPLKYVSLNHWGLQLQMISDARLLFTSVVVHWSPATLSAISSPCHWASINQSSLQADQGTCGENNMPCSHAYLNIRGLRVADDWATHHSLTHPRQWKKWSFGNT